MTATRYVYSSLLVSDDARLLRATTSALHADLFDAAKACEVSEPPERGVDWHPAILDRPKWLVGIALDHSPNVEGAPYLAPRLIHPASASEYEIRSVWAHIRSSTLFLVELNELREERGLQQGPAPRFDTAPAEPTTHTSATRLYNL